ncbi:Fe(3+)-hydroxamate ABC transporter permease FhuB [Mesorhizobium retamae]|uniref:Fe(3+)-hydroxamate ABC transporter permease FhuB n=1 Tax=Mesorhizobium retamae TaxID=2912854 RepID=A0ABS9QIV1_9HYPH|nr:Fe(3+)-hydroxamate ABC transporter permease FhuB [Mesorhizobium sp. IRAMC:0171]MCG7507335.1 Fe(3+)-hydroxamate ABC transporter permease FhuB [Mesorhizobium sp. IRAMC:0171]
MARRIPLPILLWSGLGLFACALFGRKLAVQWSGLQSGEVVDLDRVILVYGLLPRAAVALLAGAALGLSGLLLQRILRNPLAEPSTLGISAGAQLALGLATLYVPSIVERSSTAVAFAGGLVAVALILALTWRRGLEPVSVVLAGMMVALTANAAGAALILANGDYLFSLFIWGGGSLVQQGWDPAIAIGWRLALGLGAAVLLMRPLAILGLDDVAARGLGLSLNASRFLLIALAVWLAATVVAEVGIIGFVGLAAPVLATLSGARSLKQKLVAAPLIGAVLLWLTDGLVQLAAGAGGERVPTGAATALLGGPLLLWLLPRLRLFEWPSLDRPAHTPKRVARPWLRIAVLGAAGIVTLAIALLLGRGLQGWSLASDGEMLADLVAWRLPRVIVAATCGGMLAAAGVVIQRVTSNPLASPEVLGIGAGAGAGLAAVLLFAGSAGLGWQLAGSSTGALVTLTVILVIAARGNLGPERLLFAGIAMNALCSAVLAAVVALGNAQSYRLLGWLTGSTIQATFLEASVAAIGLVLITVPLLVAARWLAILPLGAGTALSVGLSVRLARNTLILIAAFASALAAQFVGPLSFAGLIAPHLARMMGLDRTRPQLAGAVILGALLMMVSDWLSRMLFFPYQLPVGLFASLLGGVYLTLLLGRGVERRG